jgi:DNA repair photolyase
LKSKNTVGRGSGTNISNPFNKEVYEEEDSFLEHLHQSGEPLEKLKTSFIKLKAKSIVNAVKSPDINHQWSLNPYQGCEHGCSYCYARESHNYWGYSAGLDFEGKILVKENAAHLLRSKLQSKSWRGEPIFLSGNTDCYQPAEKDFKITRDLLKVFLEYKNPVGILTKNALVQRDIDLLKRLHEDRLVKVAFSINTLDEKLRSKLEPRTATIKKRFESMELLAANNIPVGIMIAPIIPGLNSHEVLDIAQRAAEMGASELGYTIVRLNGPLVPLFSQWLEEHFPDRKDKVLSLIAQCHGGNLEDFEAGRRMRGEGPLAEQIKATINLAKRKYFAEKEVFKFNQEDFIHLPKGQFSLDF